MAFVLQCLSGERLNRFGFRNSYLGGTPECRVGLCFNFHVQWAAEAKWVPWDNLSTVLVALSSCTCLVVFTTYPVNNLGLSLCSSTGNGFALKTTFY